MISRRVIVQAFALILACSFGSTINAQQSDVKGSSDHPLFSRMPGYVISSYETSPFDQYNFRQANGERAPIEGKKTRVMYYITREAKAAGKVPSALQIVRNYGNAMKKIGGMVVRESPTEVTMKLVKEDGGEVWAYVWNENLDEYGVMIIEKEEMKQDVTASDLLGALEKSGRVAVYINFDTGKADIKPESMAVVDEIVSMLRNNRQIILSVEGHTDNVGGAPANLTLSEARAKAVVAALVARGVGAARLSAVGLGQTKPIGDNATEAGRAQNRRVELVRK